MRFIQSAPPPGGARNPLGRLIQYLRGFEEWLIDYAKRHGQACPIATSEAESAVNSVHRRADEGERPDALEPGRGKCTAAGALFGAQRLDVRHFKRRYPPGQRLIDLPRLAAA